MRAAQNDRKPLVRMTVEVLLRTGLRVSKFPASGLMQWAQIGAAPWLHVPVDKLREDRYLPLHPNLVALIDDYHVHVSCRASIRCYCLGRTGPRWIGTRSPG